MDKENIHTIGRMLGLVPWQSEKDYIQHLFLRELYGLISTELVFKGGTCLQKVYGLPRFSRDLDFNSNKNMNFTHTMQRLVRIFNMYGFETELQEKKHKFSENYMIIFNAPEFKNSLTVQISLREKTILKPKMVVITPLYRELAPYSVYVMHEKEILAEKVRTILTRGFPRDLYDIWFLLRKGVIIDYNIINQKTKFSKDIFKKKIKEMRYGWDRELSKIILHYPDFEEVAQTVMSHFGI